MKLRDYQEAAINSIWKYFSDGNTGNPIVAMPTGTGKSPVIGAFCKQVIERFPDQKIMMLTHVKELIEQNFEKLLLMWPTAPAGIFSAGLGRKETSPKIIFGGIGSVKNCPEAFGHVDLLLIDECHRVNPSAETSYCKFIEALKEVNPNLKVIGFTATAYRLGLGMLTEGAIFTDICIDMTTFECFNWFIAYGYLAPLTSKRTRLHINTEGVGLSGGEFKLNQLQGVVDRDEITHAALMEAMEIGHDRQHWLIFSTGVEHAEHIAEFLNTHGVPTGVVHSKMASSQRDANIEAYQNGELRALVNNNVLTTGFDSPWTDMIVCLRPTLSTSLWVQMLGRGTRPYPGKLNCLVLDYARNVEKLGPINDPVLPKKKGDKRGPAPVKLCGECGEHNHCSVRNCTSCGEEFPLTVKFGVFASETEVMKDDGPQVEVFDVDKVVYDRHEKHGAPDSILVQYYSGLQRFKTFVCVEHEGYAKKKAKEWWSKHTDMELPLSVTTALAMTKHLKTPTQIRVWVNKKYPEVLDYGFEDAPLG